MKKVEITQLGNAVINPHSLPAFTATDPSQYSDVFYAILKTNENFTSVVKEYREPKRTGTFVGIGFGASFLCLKFFCEPVIERIILCDREPYVYLMGKIFLSLVHKHTSIEDVLLNIVNYRQFSAIYQETITEENEASPLFLRKDKQELLLGVPPEVDTLRHVVFTTKDRELPEEDRHMFTETAHESGQRMWIHTFLNHAFYNIRVFREDYMFFKNLLGKITPLCIDMFHPDFWKWLADHLDWWKKPSMIYLSNAAVYSKGSDKREASVSTTYPYDPRTLKDFQTRTRAQLQYVYSYQESYYMVSMDSEPPSLADTLA